MVYPCISFNKHFVTETSASGLLNDQKETSRADKMSQRAKALAGRVDNLNSVPRIPHSGRRELSPRSWPLTAC